MTIADLESKLNQMLAARVDIPNASSDLVISSFGMSIVNNTDEVQKKYQLVDDESRVETRGVVIIEVFPNSSANQENLRAGDVIIEVGQKNVNSVDEVEFLVKEAINKDKKRALSLIGRDGDLRFFALRFKG